MVKHVCLGHLLGYRRCGRWKGVLRIHVAPGTPCPLRAQAAGYSRLVAASRGVRASHDYPAKHRELAISSWFKLTVWFDSRHPIKTRMPLQQL